MPFFLVAYHISEGFAVNNDTVCYKKQRVIDGNRRELDGNTLETGPINR